MQELVIELRTTFPALDIRQNHGDAIQVIATDVAVEITETEGGYEAKVVSLEGRSDYDFETTLITVLRCTSSVKLIAALTEYIG